MCNVAVWAQTISAKLRCWKFKLISNIDNTIVYNTARAHAAELRGGMFRRTLETLANHNTLDQLTNQSPCSLKVTGNSLKRECAGCEGSRVILTALLLTLDEYSSWRVGRVDPMIRSAVRTTLRSLLRSDLVAELNQTVIDVQRTDSMMAE